MTLAETIPGVPDQLTGPVAALVLAILGLWVLGKVIKALWEDHLRADGEDRVQRDKAVEHEERAQDLLRLSLENNKAAIEAWNRRNAADAARHRKADA